VGISGSGIVAIRYGKKIQMMILNYVGRGLGEIVNCEDPPDKSFGM